MPSKTKPAQPELRYAVVPFRAAEFRDASQTGDGSYTITGHAAVFDQETVLYDLGWWRLREKIATGAFTDVLSRDNLLVHLNLGHDMNRAIAASDVDGIGGLELSEDEQGLRVFARVDPEDPDVIAAERKMARGVWKQMSFAFIVGRSETLIEEDAAGNEDELRTIVEIAELFDVCVCAQGAYQQTSAELAMRSIARSLHVPEPRQRRRRSQQRADVASVGLLSDMYELGEQFIEDENLPEDAGDRDTMQGILDELEQLIEAEAAEPNEDEPADEPDDAADRGRQPKAGATGRRAKAGAPTVEPEQPAGGESRARELARLRTRVRMAMND